MELLAANAADPFPPAHAWLAVSIVGSMVRSQSQLKPVEANQLESHLKVASQWKAIEPALLSFYSTICLSANNRRPEKALAIARLAAENKPDLNLQYAQLCKMIGPQHDPEFNRAIKAAEKAYSAKVGKPNQTDLDRLGLAEILLMQDQREKAIEVLIQGITDDVTAHLPVRRRLADLHIERFRLDNEVKIRTSQQPKQVAVSPIDGEQEENEGSPDAKDVDWKYLQEAAKLDRDNPIVGQEIALQWRHMATPPADLIEVLRHQLKTDIAPTGARLMIAELYLIKGQIEDAQIQWTKILEKDPNVIPALNNLAVIYSRDTPPKLAQAIELIDRAYRMQPLNPEMCDTYGEVFMNAGKPMEAISKFEEAIRLDPNRILTRKKLAQCYREIGMNDMAGEQVAQIKLFQDRAVEQLQKAKSQENAPDPSSKPDTSKPDAAKADANKPESAAPMAEKSAEVKPNSNKTQPQKPDAKSATVPKNDSKKTNDSKIPKKK